MVEAEHPWSIRGGNWNNGAGAGVFTFNRADEAGSVSIYDSFRHVMITSKKISFVKSIL